MMRKRVLSLKQHLAELCTRHADALRQIEDASLLRDLLVKEIATTEADLEVAVQSPVESGEDPTGWLPDELIIMVMLNVGWMSAFECVCRRWNALRQGPILKIRRALATRWEGYATGRLTPKMLQNNAGVNCIVVAGDGAVYSSGTDFIVRRLRADGSRRTFQVGTSPTALGVGIDGTVYSAHGRGALKVWSREDESLICTLTEHAAGVTALVVDPQGNRLYSGDTNGTIQVWSCETRKLIDTFERQPHCVSALAMGMGDRIISACGRSVLMWRDGRRTSEGLGHTASVASLATSRSGLVVSGSGDGTVRVWSALDLGAIRTIQVGSHILSVAIDEFDSVFCGSRDGDVIVYASDGPRIQLYRHVHGETAALAWAPNGTLYAGFMSRGDSPRVCAFTALKVKTC